MSQLTPKDKAVLLGIARSSVITAVQGQAFQSPSDLSPALNEPAGAFVSLYHNGSLRGCVGHLRGAEPLYASIKDAANAAATRDPRFHPVQPEEIANLAVEISVLSSFQPLKPEEVQVGVHGLMITWDGARGLLLPQVAAQRGWDRERFLQETCRKAGLPPDAWRRGALIEGFTAAVFGDRSSSDEEALGEPAA